MKAYMTVVQNHGVYIRLDVMSAKAICSHGAGKSQLLHKYLE